MSDAYWVCEECGHYWASPERPDTCEFCHEASSDLTECPDIEAAEDISHEVVGHIMEGSGEE